MQIFDLSEMTSHLVVTHRMHSSILERGFAAEKPIASLLEISRILEQTAYILKRHASPEPLGEGGPGRADLVTAPLVRAVIVSRRMRRDYFPNISGDAAWSMMLELFAARLEGRRLSQTMLGTLAGIAETTALRLTRTMLRQGTFTSQDDPEDRRVILLGLSDDAASRMRAYMTAAIASGPIPA